MGDSVFLTACLPFLILVSIAGMPPSRSGPHPSGGPPFSGGGPFPPPQGPPTGFRGPGAPFPTGMWPPGIPMPDNIAAMHNAPPTQQQAQTQEQDVNEKDEVGFATKFLL